MSVTVYFANIAKKRNSTYQGTFTTNYDCVLKSATSLDRPTFLISAATMDYNAAKWDNRYYFIDDVVSVRQGQWEVSCVLDVLATYKAEILASTQFVSYSSHLSSQWLPDTRIPTLDSTDVNYTSMILSEMFNANGFYVLTVNGQNGCVSYGVTLQDLKDLIGQINSWATDTVDDIIQGTGTITYDWTNAPIESLGKLLTQTSVYGNAYANAPLMIKSCVWVPFALAEFSTGTTQRIYLGEYDTGVDGTILKTAPQKVTVNVSIPWHYTDFRRAKNENLYLYLPMVGVINIPTDEITNETAIYVDVAATATDGNVSYLVRTMQHYIGSYGANCCANYPIGINQQASAGEIINTAIAGTEKVVSTLVDSSIAPQSMAGSIAGVALEGAIVTYQTATAAKNTHPTTIGGVGGGVGSAFQLNGSVMTVAHPLNINPADMAATMGRPTMQPMSLATLTGYCQCANAHVAAAAQARELDAIDTYLNSGFFIE